MLLTKKNLIIFLCVIILCLVISICINLINNTVNKKTNNSINNNKNKDNNDNNDNKDNNDNNDNKENNDNNINNDNNQDIFSNVTSPKYEYQGCYKDGVPLAIPNLIGSQSSMTPEQCYNLALPDYDIFGLQKNIATNNVQCMAGNSNDFSIKYDKYGQQSTSLCKNDFGGALTNQVYKINTKPATTNTAYFNLINVSDPWVVPDGVTQASFTVIGGCGYGNNAENISGSGAKIVALVSVTPGDVYNIYVGGNANGNKGGLNFYGYNGSNGTGSGGGGGAATCIFNYTTPIIIAGGGGGCPNVGNLVSNSDNIGGSGGINQNGDGDSGSAPRNLTPPSGGAGGPRTSNSSIFGQQNTNSGNSGGAGGGSNGGKMGGNNTSGGGGGSYVNPNYSSNYSITTNDEGMTSVFIDYTTPRYIYKGCYNDRTMHALPVNLSKNVRVESVEECYKLAQNNYDVFGIQNGGECWAGNKATDNYKKYSNANNCAILGNPLTNQVYEVYKAPTTTTPNVFATSKNYSYKGCYKDDIKNPALPQYYDIPAKSVDDCYNLMKDDTKYNIFALQFDGECWAGNSLIDSYQKYGKVDSGCNKILGNVAKNQVYEVIRNPTTTKEPTTTKPKRTRRAPATTVPLNTIPEKANLPEIATNLINSQEILNNIKKLL